MKITQAQLLSFQNYNWGNAKYAEGEGNNRRVQPLNGRTVFYKGPELEMPTHEDAVDNFDENDDMAWMDATSSATVLLSAAAATIFTSLVI